MAALSPFSSTPLCRTITRALFDPRWHTTHSSIRSITTISHSTQASSIPEPLLRSRAHPIPEKDLPTTTTPQGPRRRRMPIPRKKYIGPPPAPQPSHNNPRSAPARPDAAHTDTSLDPSVSDLLPMLRAQPPYFIQILIHEKPYLVTAGDTIRLPFYMHGVSTGDVLRLNRATLLGSREYTLKAGEAREGAKHGWLDERLFVCRARVMGAELEPMRVMEKTKRRRRHVQHVKSKHRYTVLKVMEVTVKEPESVLASGDGVDTLAEQGSSSTGIVDEIAKEMGQLRV